jgi:hypothetical protein
MTDDVIAALESELARAEADGDEDFADILRERLQAMREGRPTGSMLRRLQPGELGRDDAEGDPRPGDRPPPKRPDPMTRNVKQAKRRAE